MNGSSLQAHEICCTHQAHVGPLLPPPLRAARSSAQALVCYPLDFRSPPRIGSVAPIAMLCTALPALVGLMLFGWHAPSRGGVKHAPLGVVPSFGVLPQYFDCLASCRNCRERERERGRHRVRRVLCSALHPVWASVKAVEWERERGWQSVSQPTPRGAGGLVTGVAPATSLSFGSAAAPAAGLSFGGAGTGGGFGGGAGLNAFGSTPAAAASQAAAAGATAVGVPPPAGLGGAGKAGVSVGATTEVSRILQDWHQDLETHARTYMTRCPRAHTTHTGDIEH